MPALRHRPLDLPSLAAQASQAFRAAKRTPHPDFTPAAMTAMQRYPWPGNLRELRNVIERAVILTPGDKVDVNDFPETLRGTPASGAVIGNRVSLETSNVSIFCASSRSPTAWTRPHRSLASIPPPSTVNASATPSSPPLPAGNQHHRKLHHHRRRHNLAQLDPVSERPTCFAFDSCLG